MWTFARKIPDGDPVFDAMWGTNVVVDVISVVLFFMFLFGSILQGGYPNRGGGRGCYFLALTCVRKNCVSTNISHALISI